MDKESKIAIVGHDDVIENALLDHFQSNGFKKVTSFSRIALNPTIQASVYQFFQETRPEYVFLGSTRSGGIEANIKSPAEFLYHNLESQNNVIYSSWKWGVKKLLYIGASCAYPKDCAQPMKEEYLLTGQLEKTSESYSIAKIAGIKLCQAYRKQYGFNAIAIIPATIYGPKSDVDLEKAHVMGALIAKFSQAVKKNEREVIVWGTGEPRREFLYKDDFIEACLFMMDRYNAQDHINIGAGVDVSIKELAETIAQTVGFKGQIKFDSTKPNGAMQKLLDLTRIQELGWRPKTNLKDGISKTYAWYKDLEKRGPS